MFWDDLPEYISRRKLLEMSGLGLGTIALATLLKADKDRRIYSDLKPRKGHFPGTAKAVIQFVQNGGPSQMDLFDPKPELTKWSGKPHPDGVEIHQPNNANVLLASPFQFRKHGQSGIELGETLPHLATVADDICVIRSMHTEHNNHPEGLNMLLTCRIFPGRPVLGAWVSYALGTENQNLPAFVVLRDPEGYSTLGKQLWTSGWLPALYQGVEFSSTGTPVRHLHPTVPPPPGAQRERLDTLAKLNQMHQQRHSGDSELEARIQNYELAARMQLAAVDVLDISKESDATQKLYGLDNPVTAGYGLRCLMARRLVEARRSLRANLSGERATLGPSLQYQEEHAGDLRPNRPAYYRLAERPEEPRPAGEHYSDVGGRVRAPSDHPKLRRSRPQPQRVQPVAGRRRLQGGPRLRRDR